MDPSTNPPADHMERPADDAPLADKQAYLAWLRETHGENDGATLEYAAELEEDEPAPEEPGVIPPAPAAASGDAGAQNQSQQPKSPEPPATE